MTLHLMADDFGATAAFNRGILKAHQAGVITAVSLMVGEAGSAEAVDMARCHPALRVGLHLTFSDARPVLDPLHVPMLVMPDGSFPANETKLHRALLSRSGREQIRAEMRAQFQRFAATGLSCHHVNTHRNSYVHPLLAAIVFREAKRNGVANVRIPWDEMRPRQLTDPLRFGRGWVLRQIAAQLGLHYDDQVIGQTWSVASLLDVLARLPTDGSAELYFHPVDAADHPFSGDLPALLNADVVRVLHARTK